MKIIPKIKWPLSRVLILVSVSFYISSCAGQLKEKTANDQIEITSNNPKPLPKVATTFPQIHTNLNGMVREFVRSMYQDKKGNYWFGTNGNGIIYYDGQNLKTATYEGITPFNSIREIVEDAEGNVWFSSSDGLIKYDGLKYTKYSTELGLQNADIWGLTIDKKGLIWVGSVDGVSHFNGTTFTTFSLPSTKVENPDPMISDRLVFKFLEDKNGTMWMVNDGNGIFKYKDESFIHLTIKNGLTDNNASDLIEDKYSNIWIGTFNGGVSKYDPYMQDRLGKTYTNYTKDGIIEGVEAYNFYEDSRGNIWFSAEGLGVYRYDGKKFTQFTTENGLTTNVVQNIFEDSKGQIWCSSWQGICIFDGQKFVNAVDLEPWTK